MIAAYAMILAFLTYCYAEAAKSRKDHGAPFWLAALYLLTWPLSIPSLALLRWMRR